MLRKIFDIFVIVQTVIALLAIPAWNQIPRSEMGGAFKGWIVSWLAFMALALAIVIVKRRNRK